MSTVFDLDFKRIQKDVFWGEDYKISQTSSSKLDEKILISYFYINIFNFFLRNKNKNTWDYPLRDYERLGS